MFGWFGCWHRIGSTFAEYEESCGREIRKGGWRRKESQGWKAINFFQNQPTKQPTNQAINQPDLKPQIDTDQRNPKVNMAWLIDQYISREQNLSNTIFQVT